MEETIKITKKEYEELKSSQTLLFALQGAGVDNWEGWDDAIEIFQEMDGE